MTELRIYYEALEQVRHFLEPSVRKAIPEVDAVRPIRLSKLRADSRVAASIHATLGMKDPDALLTYVHDGVEHPLVLIEFSTAVATRDHDLQRFDAYIAAAAARVPFVKIYAARSSRSSHGGGSPYDHNEPFQLLAQKHATPGFLLEWPLVDEFTAAFAPGYPACPPPLPLLDGLLETLWALRVPGADLAQRVLDESDTLPPELQQQLEQYRQPLAPPLIPTSTRLSRTTAGQLSLKFNRWDHAMDPERGLAWFYASRVGRLAGRLIDKTAIDTRSAYENFCRATGFDRTLAHRPLSGKPQDISGLVAAAKLSRPGMAIFSSCDRFEVTDTADRVLLDLRWTTMPVAPVVGHSVDATAIRTTDRLTEDEVTYCIAHDVLASQGFTLISVSYPGAQGDFALVSGTGRKASRTYIDIVAVKAGHWLSLTESKGKTNSGTLAKEVAKLTPWRDDPARHALLRDRVSNSGVEGDEKLTLSVAFAEGGHPLPCSALNELDFFVSVNHDRWTIWRSTSEIPLSTFGGVTSIGTIYCY